MKNRALIGLSLFLSILLFGCGGGTIGTGVRKAAIMKEEPRKQAAFWDLFNQASARCVNKDDKGFIDELRVFPGELLSSGTIVGGKCRFELLPIKPELRLQLLFREEKLSATLTIEERVRNSEWRLIDYRKMEVSGGEYEATFSSDRFVRGREYRMVVIHQGDHPYGDRSMTAILRIVHSAR